MHRTESHQRYTHRAPAPWPLLALALALAAACGGSGAGAEGASSSSSSTDSRSGPGAGSPAAPDPGPGAPTPPAAYAHEWVVSPSGSDSAAGTAGAPFRTIGRAVSAAGPGDRVTVKAGTYAERVAIGAGARSGTEAQPILLQGEGKPKIVPGAGQMMMVEIGRPHWILDGFEVDAQNQNRIGVGFVGSTEGSILRSSLVHAGSGPAAVTVSDGATGVTIEDMDIHHFWRNGQDSHGVAVEPGTRHVTVRDSRIHDVSGDSVQCIGPEGESSRPPAEYVTVEHNDFSSNKENALDIKTCKHVVARKNVFHDFLQQSTPGGCAVVIHMSADDVLIEDNEIYRVGKAIALGGNHTGPPPQRVRIQRNRIHDVQLGSGLPGLGMEIQNATAAKVVGNTFTRIGSAAISLGDGVGGPTQDLRVADNLFDAAVPLIVGASAPGLSLASNGFRPDATFKKGGVSYDWAGFQGQGFTGKAWVSPQLLANGDTLAPAPGAVDQGVDEGFAFCGAAPDLGAVETGCGG